MIDNVILKDLSSVKNTFLYRVEVGDNLSLIANKFHTTQIVLIALNGLESEPLVGEYILIKKIEGEEYIVMPGDTFEKIAQNNNKIAQEIIRKNKTDCIYVGQKIYI